jgi:hypothetical protein
MQYGEILTRNYEYCVIKIQNFLMLSLDVHVVTTETGFINEILPFLYAF